MKRRAYLDIETTGLQWDSCDLTVVGIALESGPDAMEVIQLVGDEATDVRLIEVLAGTDEIYTYNGSRFDLPFIARKLHIDLKKDFTHTDLMHFCWKRRLMGGLKRVEAQLGIVRSVTDVDGWIAVELWWRYVNNDDRVALTKLLAYNREDVLNLQTLRVLLDIG